MPGTRTCGTPSLHWPRSHASWLCFGRTARPKGGTLPKIELTYNCKVIIRDRAADAQAVLDAQLEANTIDPATAGESFWVGTVEGIAERLAEFVALGFETFTIEAPAPFDRESLERLIGEVKPLLERG